MRRQVVILLLAVLLAVSALTAAAVQLGDAQEQVTYTAAYEYGDRSAADGLTVSMTYTYGYYPYWFSTLTFGQENTEKTDFRYCFSRPEQSADDRYDHSTLLIHTVSNNNGVDLEHQMTTADSEPTGLVKAYQELYDATPEGEVTNTYIRYGDYCEYYPLEGQFTVSAASWPFWHSYDPSPSGKRVAEVFCNYFRIPVLPDDWIRMAVDKRATSSSMASIDMSEPRKGADYYEMGSEGAFLDGTAYFAINAYTNAGNLVDTSLIPGGYGLYSFRYDEKGYVDADSLTTVMPLDIRHRPVEMLADTQTGRLLYITELEGDRYLTVIDPKEAEILQQLPIQEYRNVWRWYRFEKDLLYCVTEREKVDVFRQNAEGLYEKVFTAPLTATDAPQESRDLYESVLAFDGERIAVLRTLWTKLEENGTVLYGDQACGFSLSVYTQDGLAYSGDYTSSLEQKSDDWTNVGVQVYSQSLAWGVGSWE